MSPEPIRRKGRKTLAKIYDSLTDPEEATDRSRIIGLPTKKEARDIRDELTAAAWAAGKTVSRTQTAKEYISIVESFFRKLRAIKNTETRTPQTGIPTLRELLKDKLAAYAEKGQVGRTIRVMVLGIPNVGKSTFINKVAKRKTARAEDRPGVTRSKQWVPVDATLELLDTPGILWPKFDDTEVGKRLAFTGAIKDDVLDIEELACYLMDYLAAHYADVLRERYRIDVEEGDSGYELLEKAGRKRGFLMRGAQVDTERMARILLDEFRGGKLGRFTLETVEDCGK